MKAVILITLCVALVANALQAPLPGGTVSGAAKLSKCPSGFASGATCYSGTINCPNTAPLVATWGVLTPSGALAGTICTASGSGGTSPFDNGIIAKFQTGQFRTVEIDYATDWENTGTGFTKNILTAGCRPATAFAFAYSHYHVEGKLLGFGILGQSGGSAQVAYTMTWYNGTNYVDSAVMGAGPVFGNVYDGCRVPNAPQQVICPPNQYGCSQSASSFYHSPTYGGGTGCSLASAGTGVGAWTGYDCACNANGNTGAAAEASWRAQSVVQPGMILNFPKSAMTQVICLPTTNNSGAQGQYLANNMTAARTPVYAELLAASCTSNEQWWAGTILGQNGLTYVANYAMQTTVPRHQ